MIKRFAGIIVIGVLLSQAGCRRHDWRTLELDVPEMRNKPAVEHVMQALSRGPGIKPGSAVVDIKNGRIRIEYDSIQAADMNFIHLVRDAGFAVNGLPADPQAREALPPALLP